MFMLRLLDDSELSWQIRRLSPTPTAIDGIAQLITLLPDIAAANKWGVASGEILLAAAGPAELQQAVLVAIKILTQVLGSGIYEVARDSVLQQKGLAAAAAAASGVAGGVGGVGRLCLIGLLTPEKLGFSAAEGERA